MLWVTFWRKKNRPTTFLIIIVIMLLVSVVDYINIIHELNAASSQEKFILREDEILENL